MGQIRFQIGIPRAGSSALGAEQEQQAARFALPRAGSAAKMAEDEKVAQGEGMRPQAGFSLRGQNGVVTRNAPVTPTISNWAGVHETLPGAEVHNHAPAPNTALAQPSTMPCDDVVQPPDGPMQVAASRFQALIRSLFGSDKTTGTF
jgi:hypothetical protein